ncbi:hypothetical protein [Mycobacterium sp. TY815]|uniref:hypothetical protein n=1 Tax=Mycobacterium sp. TY815 TaxID=3050581 RepID=UPI00274135D4|nr:hypothetical protein [Mycobacterium sp. TY815]MDP7707431.1 hypothetical protein [Mycobacterium sp. TY815]
MIYIRCQFSVDQPFTYNVGGAQYAGSRMNASNCQTNLPSAPVTLEFHMQVGYGDQPGEPQTFSAATTAP